MQQAQTQGLTAPLAQAVAATPPPDQLPPAVKAAIQVSAPAAEPMALAMPSPTAQPATAEPARDPSKGAVTSLPLPRFVSLKTGEGNARRGPGLTHRIDWVFTRVNMPLRITAEYENWRRVEDADGEGGWIHYSLLSGVRSVMVQQDMAEFRAQPDDRAEVVFQAEMGVIGKIVECHNGWCRVSLDGEKGWVAETALWGVDPGEDIE
ncbi:MAG: SH3 domain-containing protein [Exiguobacterium profundum]|nr:MAG: SH3 domain-containing protein [Exiguobacterium profundum]